MAIEPAPVKDKYFLCHCLFYSMGVLTLVPSHFFSTANDYWMYKFRNTSEDFVANASAENRTSLQASFSSAFSVAGNVSMFVFLALAFIVTRRFSFHKNMLAGLTLLVTFFVINIILVQVNTDSAQHAFFGISITLTVCLIASAAVVMITIFELAARFPLIYTSLVLSGQAICGILAALAQILSLAMDAHPTTVALVYFGIGTAIIVSITVLYVFVARYSEFFMHYSNAAQQQFKTANRPPVRLAVLKPFFQKTKWYMASILLVLGSTVVMQPGVTSLVVSRDKGNGNKWNDTFFVPVITFLMYNVVDLIGREMGGLRWPKNPKITFLIVVLRLGLIPLLLMCNEQPRKHMAVQFNDYEYCIILLVFAFTHGYLFNMSIISVSKVVTKEQKILTSLMILITVIIALAACSFLSFLFVDLL